MNFPEPALHLTGPVLYAEKALCVIWRKVHSVNQQPPEAAKNCVVKERQSSAPLAKLPDAHKNQRRRGPYETFPGVLTQRKVPHLFRRGTFLTRRSRDLNPGCGFPHYSLSRGAPSATWVLLQAGRQASMLKRIGGERGIRTPGVFRASLVFKTSAFNRSAISPHLEPAKIIISWECVHVKQFFPGSFGVLPPG